MIKLKSSIYHFCTSFCHWCTFNVQQYGYWSRYHCDHLMDQRSQKQRTSSWRISFTRYYLFHENHNDKPHLWIWRYALFATPRNCDGNISYGHVSYSVLRLPRSPHSPTQPRTQYSVLYLIHWRYLLNLDRQFNYWPVILFRRRQQFWSAEMGYHRTCSFDFY